MRNGKIVLFYVFLGAALCLGSFLFWLKASRPTMSASAHLPFSPVYSVINQQPICPDDYATAEEQTAAMGKWENEFFDSHQEALLMEMAQARLQFYKDNNCTAALQRYEDAKNGKADPETLQMIKSKIKQTLEN